VSLTERAVERIEQLSEHSLTERERRIVELTAKYVQGQGDFLLKLRAANLARNREWDPQGKISLTFRSTELAGEIGEVCNEVKKLERERLGLKGSRTSLAKLAAELADGLICLDLLAMEFGIDLAEAVRAKFNATSEERGLEVWL
jgi:NTP pyrophosphatase (non-canonical NTP hydrolase)